MQLKKLVSHISKLFPFTAFQVFIPLFQIKSRGRVYYWAVCYHIAIGSFYSIINFFVKSLRNECKCLLVLHLQQDKIKKIPEHLQPFFFRRQNFPYKFPNAAFVPYSK